MKRLGLLLFSCMIASLIMFTYSFPWIGKSSTAYPHPVRAQSPLDWVLINTASSPLARVGHAMAHDSARGKVVLFGGYDGSTLLNDTWEYDGNNWVQVNTAHAPTPRMYHKMVYDSNRGRIVLFGGSLGGYTESGETWEYDGEDWMQISTPTLPFSRAGHAMAYDSARGKVVLQGGQNRQGPGSVVVFSGTWEYDGIDWMEITTGDPGNFSFHDMAYGDAAHKAILAHKTFIGTWEWDGASWIKISTPSSPPRRDYFALVFDRIRSRVVLFGGGLQWPNVFNDTWEFDGADWQQITTENLPPARSSHDMVYNTNSNRIVLFSGGYWDGDAREWVLFEDTWELRGPSPTPTATPTATTTMTLTSTPTITPTATATSTPAAQVYLPLLWKSH